ncbi:MAG TPA: hypothetical protein VFN32_04190 [Rhodococcus sp. (in: high G+C Gram-positive bacteria)]|nr:hypothetical protein [Rhodococcus sp. (in: high G+C Gram-positive bacteria)]
MKKPLVAGLACLTVCVLSACGTDSGSAETDATSTPSAAVVPSEVVLSDPDAPAGYIHTDVADTLDSDVGEVSNDEVIAMFTEISGSTVTDPAECGVLVPTAVDTVLRLNEDRAGTAVSEYTSDGTDGSDSAITIMVTTSDTGPRAPENLDGCASFTRTSSSGDTEASVTYRVSPLDLDVEGADTLIAARAEADQGGAAESTTLVAGTVDGVYFQINATGPVDDQLVSDLAELQIGKIEGV